MVSHFAFPVTAPMPKIDPQETWVVETGTPIFEAPKTIMPVIRLAVKAWPNSISVIRCPLRSRRRQGGLFLVALNDTFAAVAA